jgi:hypothetical protein
VNGEGRAETALRPASTNFGDKLFLCVTYLTLLGRSLKYSA